MPNNKFKAHRFFLVDIKDRVLLYSAFSYRKVQKVQNELYAGPIILNKKDFSDFLSSVPYLRINNKK